MLTWGPIEAIGPYLVGDATLEVPSDEYEALEKVTPKLDASNLQAAYQQAMAANAMTQYPRMNLEWRGPRGRIVIRRRPTDKERIAELERLVADLQKGKAR